MQHNTSFISTVDGTSLFLQEWTTEDTPLAIIIFVHGIGEHSSRYKYWADCFVKHQMGFVSFDQRGHGESEGKRGVISSYNDFLNDIDVVLEEVKMKYPEVPCILYGHSMGGGEVLNHLLKRKANYLGVICTSPWIIAQAAPPKIVLPIIRFLNGVIPAFTLKTKFDSSLLSHDTDIVNRYDNDPSVHHKLSFRLFVEAYDAGYYILNSKNRIQKQLLLLHGSDDGITDSLASADFAHRNSKYCTFELWKGGYHELHNEPFKNEVFEFILKWILDLLDKNKK